MRRAITVIVCLVVGLAVLAGSGYSPTYFYKLNVGSITSTGVVTGSNFVSTVATGTAPFASASTTLCTNVNADRLDSLEGSAFGQLAVANTWTANQTAPYFANSSSGNASAPRPQGCPFSNVNSNDMEGTMVPSGSFSTIGGSNPTPSISTVPGWLTLDQSSGNNAFHGTYYWSLSNSYGPTSSFTCYFRLTHANYVNRIGIALLDNNGTGIIYAIAPTASGISWQYTYVTTYTTLVGWQTLASNPAALYGSLTIHRNTGTAGVDQFSLGESVDGVGFFRRLVATDVDATRDNLTITKVGIYCGNDVYQNPATEGWISRMAVDWIRFYDGLKP